MSKFVDKFCFSKQIFFAAILFITIFLFFIVAIKINSNQKTTITKAETVQPIIGGHPADPGEWPFMVYIQHNASFGISRVYCGGALISPKWIITARHCLTFDVEMKYKVSPYNLRVVLNLYKLSDNNNKKNVSLIFPKVKNTYLIEPQEIVKVISECKEG